ncbi:MAG: DUF2585 family protein [Planctomycetes bacterium]|nr:DUF2585 family protein [Planctomycetota bacterium]
MPTALPSPARERLAQALVLTALLTTTVAYLRGQGRIPWCACGRLFPWTADIWSAHCSQHLLDPYSTSHLLHGVLFCGLLAWTVPKLALAWRFCIAVALEVLWEMLENSQLVIQRYREGTIAQGYTGDGIVNSLADILCCAGGFLLARRLGLRLSIALFVAIELTLLLTLKDNLSLNVLMLLCPIPDIKAWQSAR